MIKNIKAPKELDIICQDLKVCGRREFSDLLKLRYKYNVEKDRQKKALKAQEEDENNEELTNEQLEQLVDKELDDTLKRVEREKKKQAKKERERDAKQELRKKMSVIAATSLDNDEDLTLDKKTKEFLKSIDPEDIEKYLPAQEPDEDEQLMNEDPLEKKYKFLTDGGGDEKSDDESSISEDEKVTRVD